MSEWKLGNPNKTFGYILPVLHQNGKLKVSDFYSEYNIPTNNFINAFISCEEYPELDRHIFLLYKFTPAPIFNIFEQRLSFLPEYVMSYDPDKYNRMFVFKISDEYLDLFEKFKAGKYSKFLMKDKDIIMNFHLLGMDKYARADPPLKNIISGTLFKQKWKKEQIESEIINSPDIPKHSWIRLPDDAEFSSVPNFEHETYLNKYKLPDETSLETTFD